MKLSSLLKNFAPSRVIGALRRRAKHLGVSFVYKPGRVSLRNNTVLFESFQGKYIGDSPYDIFLEMQRRKPEMDFVWAVNSQTKAPEGSRSVRWGSWEWLRTLASAKYLVNNSNFPWFFRKAPGQVYLQTWHGTPLKKLGRDIPGATNMIGHQSTMEREAKNWDYLLAPNEFFAEVFPRAYNYSGTCLLTGYPRNDRLVRAHNSERQAIRKKLGVADATKLVLYAPTWRDYKRTVTGNWDAVNYLDSGLQLPEGMRLMFRGHHATMQAHSDSVAKDAIDVTDYPDITDLFLAADILITDYSSVMFDFTVTGKPVLFFAPDLDRYRADRGFYLDYETQLPGPILKTSDEVVQALAQVEQIIKKYSKAYAAWVKKYNALEDGQAAKRAVDAFLSN